MPSRFVIVQLVTVVRVPLSILFAALLMLFSGGLPAAGRWGLAALLLAGEVTDALDGLLARRWDVKSEFGAMLDPYADSVSRIIVYWALSQVGLALAAVPLVMALRDITVAYCRIMLARSGRSVSANWSGKVKAVVQCVGAFCLLLCPLAPKVQEPTVTGVSWIIMLATAASSIQYIRAAATTAAAFPPGMPRQDDN